MAVKAQLSSKTIFFIQVLNTIINQKCPKSRKVERRLKNSQGTICPPLNGIIRFFIRVSGATDGSFRKMELLEFEEEEEANARIDNDDADVYD